MSFKTLAEELAYNEDQEVSNDEIKYQLHDDVNVITYLELENISEISELFRKSNNCIILFPVDDRNSGHYVALMYYPELNTLSYFDPYGMSIFSDISYSAYLKKQEHFNV